MEEKDFIADMARKMLQKGLERNNGNIEAAAKEMGVSTETLLRRLEQNGIKPEDYVGERIHNTETAAGCSR